MTENALDSAALLPHQERFVENFSSGAPGSVHLLIGSHGTGKTRVSAVLIAEELRSGVDKRILLITSVSQAAQFKLWFQAAHVPATFLWLRTRDLREAEASTETSHGLWREPGIYAMTSVTAGQSRMKESLLNEDWDFLLVTEAYEALHESEVATESKRGTGKIKKTLLLSCDPDARALAPRFKNLQLTEWTTLEDQQGRNWPPAPRIEDFSFKPSNEEITFRRKLHDFAKSGERHPRAEFVADQLEARARSSPLAVETALRGLKAGLAGKDSGLVWLRAAVGLMDTDASLFNWNLPTPAQESIFQESIWHDQKQAAMQLNGLLEELDRIYSDPKFAALLQVLSRWHVATNSPANATCIITSFSVTASYLRSALSETFAGVQVITSNAALPDMSTSLSHFHESGGILVATSASLQGVDLRAAKALIHYDVPGTEETLLRTSRSPLATNIVLRESR